MCILGHSVPSRIIKPIMHKDQQQTARLFEGISHFHDSLRITALWRSVLIFPTTYSTSTSTSMRRRPTKAIDRGRVKDMVSLWGSYLAPDTIPVPFHFHIRTFFFHCIPVPAPWTCWMPLASLIGLLGSPLRVSPCSVFYFLFYPPTESGCLLLLYLSAHTRWRTLSGHSALGVSLYLRGWGPGQSSHSFPAWVLASPMSIPDNMSLFHWGIWRSPLRSIPDIIGKQKITALPAKRPAAHVHYWRSRGGR